MKHSKRAVVIGASMAGLLAARALSYTFTNVIVIDRDVLPDSSVARRSVPQGKHLHGLLARGLNSLNELFPGFEDEMMAAGAARGDIQADIHWYVDGYLMKPVPSGLIGIASSRPLLELKVRERVAALPGVEIIQNCDVLDLRTTGERGRVTGVGIMSRTDGAAATTIEADLVVDAGGRGSRSPVWLEELGYQRPQETKVAMDITYSTRMYRREPQDLDGRLGTGISTYPGSPHGGFLLAVEADQFILSVGGMFGEQPPMDDEGLAAYAETLPCKDIADFLRTSTRLTEPVKTRCPASIRRHYEKLTDFPAGYLVTGDALCSFNPVYGQGMTVAALEALLLRDLLAAGPKDLARRFFHGAAKLVDTPWTIATGSDMRFPEANISISHKNRLLNRYFGRVYLAASRDSAVATVFLRVINLVDTPARLFAPGMVARVVRACFPKVSRVSETTLVGGS
ncbi:FAD-dependent oxidoreductase [Streptomyces sp. NPDC057717]|uniref:FAD-dependent oxidoreductase n=1 Tax=Streptomyces sp. NPDC057717 TaxID=3346224 RepID=UPI0036CDE837